MICFATTHPQIITKKFGRYCFFTYLCSINRTIMTNDEEILVKILKLSHDQVMAGKSYSQEEAEHYLDQRLYEFRDKMVGTCVAEPC